MPVSLSLSTNRVLGGYLRASLVDVVRPPLDRLAVGIEQLNHDLRVMSLDMIDLVNGLAERRLKVQVMNEALLDHIEATHWAIAYFSYNTFLELLDHVAYLRWLAGRSHLHLHDIIDGLDRLDTAVSAFADQLLGLTSAVVGLLQQILDQLAKGLKLTGAIQLVGGISMTGVVTIKIEGGEKEEAWWKKVLKWGLGLGEILGFLALLGPALSSFKAGALIAAAAVVMLAHGLIPLIELLSKLTLLQLGAVALGFGEIVLFVWGLGRAFRAFTTDLSKVVPQLNAFFEAIGKLMDRLAALKGWDLARIAVGFAEIAGFVWLLGRAFQTFTTDLTKVIPQLDAFFDVIGKLMTKLAAFSGGDLAGIAFGFLSIAGFVWLLSQALGTLTADAVAAMPALGTLLGAFGDLATKLGDMSGGEMVTMVIGLAAIAGFTWAVAAALNFAAGPLATLEKLFGRLGGALSGIADLGRGVIGVLSGITDVVGGIVDKIGSVVGAVGSAVSKVAHFYANTVSRAAGALSDAASTAGDFLGSVFHGVGDFLFGDDTPDPAPTPAPVRDMRLAAVTPAPPPEPGLLAPGGALAAATPAGTTTVDQSVNAGGIYVTVTAERLDGDSARLLTDDIVAQLQARLDALRSTQQFQAGARPAMA